MGDNISNHNEAVRELLNYYMNNYNIKKVYTDLPGMKTIKIAGEVPDIFLVFRNGKEKIVEVDTKPMSKSDIRQHKTFKRSAASKPNVRSYEHYFASEVIGWSFF